MYANRIYMFLHNIKHNNEFENSVVKKKHYWYIGLYVWATVRLSDTYCTQNWKALTLSSYMIGWLDTTYGSWEEHVFSISLLRTKLCLQVPRMIQQALVSRNQSLDLQASNIQPCIWIHCDVLQHSIMNFMYSQRWHGLMSKPAWITAEGFEDRQISRSGPLSWHRSCPLVSAHCASCTNTNNPLFSIDNSIQSSGTGACELAHTNSL